MIGSFKFNNVESSSFNLVCKSVKRPLLPAIKVKRIELPGVSGAYDFENSEYALRSVTMRIAYIGSSYSDLRSKARSIAAWLSLGTWAKLIINDETDKYYLAKVTGEIELESLWESGSADITFDCQPFAYSINEETLTSQVAGTTNYEFVNPGNRTINYKSPQGSKFKITVAGTFTTLSLSMNGSSLTYAEAINGTLIIDNIEMEVALGGVNKFNVIGGSIDTFLKIIPGNNILTIGGTGLNVNVTINYIPMWI
jgi:predicted phage tail component-like protein